MKYLQTFENYSPDDSVYSDEHVIDLIKNITPEETDLPNYFMEKLIKGRTFKRQTLKIKDLLKSDASFKEYVDTDISRYDEEEVDKDDLDYPIVVVDGEVLDGYSRTSTLHQTGIEEVEAYVAI